MGALHEKITTRNSDARNSLTEHNPGCPVPFVPLASMDNQADLALGQDETNRKIDELTALVRCNGKGKVWMKGPWGMELRAKTIKDFVVAVLAVGVVVWVVLRTSGSVAVGG